MRSSAGSMECCRSATLAWRSSATLRCATRSVSAASSFRTASTARSTTAWGAEPARAAFRVSRQRSVASRTSARKVSSSRARSPSCPVCVVSRLLSLSQTDRSASREVPGRSIACSRRDWADSISSVMTASSASRASSTSAAATWAATSRSRLPSASARSPISATGIALGASSTGAASAVAGSWADAPVGNARASQETTAAVSAPARCIRVSIGGVRVFILARHADVSARGAVFPSLSAGESFCVLVNWESPEGDSRGRRA